MVCRRNSLLKCVSQPEIAKNSLNPYFGGSKSFKVIGVGTTGKLVSSVCYDVQQVCVFCNHSLARLDDSAISATVDQSSKRTVAYHNKHYILTSFPEVPTTMILNDFEPPK